MKRTLPFIVGFLIAWNSLWSQQMSLGDCIDYAIKNHPDIRNANVEKRIVEENTNISRKERLPNLTGSFSQSGSLGRNIDPFSNDVITQGIYYSALGFGSSISLYNGGKGKLEISNSLIREKMNAWDVQTIIADKKREILTLYLQALVSKANIQIRKLRKEEMEKQLEKLDELILEGFKSKSDRLEVELTQLEVDYGLAQVENTNQNDIIKLKAAIFYDFQSAINLKEPELTFPDTTGGLQFAQTPIYYKTIEQLKSTEIDNDLLKAQYKPSVNLNLNWGTSFSSAAPSEFSLGKQLNYNFGQFGSVSMSLPIFNKSQKKHYFQINQLKKMQVENNLRNYENEFLRETEQLANEIELGKEKIRNMEKQLDVFNGLIEFETEKYFEGRITYNELNTWQNKLDEARLNLKLAKYQLFERFEILKIMRELDHKL